MNLRGILLLGNDMIIPRDPRDWGNPWGVQADQVLNANALISKSKLAGERSVKNLFVSEDDFKTDLRLRITNKLPNSVKPQHTK